MEMSRLMKNPLNTIGKDRIKEVTAANRVLNEMTLNPV
ncbi:hypothetical protein ALP23_00280 [Pseudomonas syringae pv. apii]|uniref:Uncharacterized protein n=1 Tax=Pseudomonas syringae pv. apii TaxID=81036 RepID=A0A3M5WHE3_9PSED|nr:hypothetical protein ALP23_00280 [Pseudomonas syringae pv. apii]